MHATRRPARASCDTTDSGESLRLSPPSLSRESDASVITRPSRIARKSRIRRRARQLCGILATVWERVPYTEVYCASLLMAQMSALTLALFACGGVKSAQAQDWTDYLHWPYVPPQVPGNGFEYNGLYDGWYRYPREQRIVPQIQGPYYRNEYGGYRVFGIFRHPQRLARMGQEEVVQGLPLTSGCLLRSPVQDGGDKPHSGRLRRIHDDRLRPAQAPVVLSLRGWPGPRRLSRYASPPKPRSPPSARRRSGSKPAPRAGPASRSIHSSLVWAWAMSPGPKTTHGVPFSLRGPASVPNGTPPT